MEPLHINTKGGDTHGFVGIECCLTRHTMASGEEYISSAEGESQQSCVELTRAGIDIDIAAPEGDQEGMVEREGTQEAKAAGIMGMEEVGAEEA